MDSDTKDMVIQYEKSFGTEALLKVVLSNIDKILVEKGIISEEELCSKLRTEITFDIAKRATGL